MGQVIKVEFSESKLGDVPDTWASAELAFKEMGWKPSISLEEGLKQEVNCQKGCGMPSPANLRYHLLSR